MSGSRVFASLNRRISLNYTTKSRIVLSLLLGLVCCGAVAEPMTVVKLPREVRIELPSGILSIRPLMDGVIRVRFAQSRVSESPSVVLVKQPAPPKFAVREDSRSVTVDAGKLLAVLDRSSLALRFTDSAGKILLQETPGGRLLTSSDLASGQSGVVQQSFTSPPDEHLFGTGQFQDGYLNIRGLPRRLTQVNTQIAIPFLLSSKGYGLLWHNYGRTDFDPADTEIALSQSGSGQKSAVDVTTTNGTQQQTRQEATFVGEFRIARAGEHGILLDMGQAMAHQYRVEIDGKIAVDYANYWLPPTTSWLMKLEAGRHTVRVTGMCRTAHRCFCAAQRT